MLTKEEREEVRRVSALMKQALLQEPTAETLELLSAAPATVDALLDSLDEMERERDSIREKSHAGWDVRDAAFAVLERERDEWKTRAEKAEAALSAADLLFMELGKSGHILDRVLGIMEEGRMLIMGVLRPR